MRIALPALFFIGVAAQPAGAEGCVIVGDTMECPRGVTIGGVGQSVIIGGKASSRGTGERRTPDGREVHDFGNSGVIIGGQGEAERQQ